MTIAVAAPDSVLAVAPRLAFDAARLRATLAAFSATTIAIGTSRAQFAGGVIDGEALDVEAWAPYPLPVGMWVADALQ